MIQKPEVQLDKLYQKLYNVELWLLAYQQVVAPHPRNMADGVDRGSTKKSGRAKEGEVATVKKRSTLHGKEPLMYVTVSLKLELDTDSGLDELESHIQEAGRAAMKEVPKEALGKREAEQKRWNSAPCDPDDI
jgi:hypothetical protein